jgi:glutaredoxin
MPTVEVVLYTKPGCCLCDTVKAQLQKLRGMQPFELREVNILEDEAALAKFQEEIPVVFINGRKAFKYHLDEKSFLRLLASRPAQGEKPQYGS